MNEQKAAKAFKALGDENRIRILLQLKSGEKCACRLLEALDVSQPTLSHHMRILCDSGLVSGRKEGRWTYYSIDEGGVRTLSGLLREMTAVRPGAGRDSCCDSC